MTSSATVVLITGANQGLGFYTAHLLSQSSTPYNILIGSRSLTNGEAAIDKLKAHPTNSTISTIQLDITSNDSIPAAVEKVTADHGRLDILINNAAIGSAVRGQMGSSSSLADWAPVFQTNVVGTAAVTEAFLPLLQKSSDAKLIILSSSVGSITMAEASPVHPRSTTASPYRASKAAVNMMIVEWTKLWKKHGIRVWGVDPGLCATDFVGEYSRSKGRDPREGAQIIVEVVEGKRDHQIGKVCWEQNGEGGVRPW